MAYSTTSYSPTSYGTSRLVTTRHIDLKKLRYFTTVAELGSFTKAARQLHIAQPALSRQVRMLEENLGLQLLSRSTRGVVLTDAGQILLNHARALAANLAHVVEDMHARAGSPKGQVTIGLPPSSTAILAAPLVRRVHRDFPGVSLRILDGLSFVLADWLEIGKIDLAVLGYPIQSRILALEPIAIEDVVVVEKATVGAVPPVYSLPALSAKPLIVSDYFAMIVRQALNIPTLELNTLLHVEAVEALRELVLDGFGAAILPVSLFRRELESGEVKARAITSRGVRRTLTLARPTLRQQTIAADAVANVIREEIAALEQAGHFTLARFSRNNLRRRAPA